jgi:hypothetical protein
MPVVLDGLGADLRTEKIYSLAEGTNHLQYYNLAQVDGLLELDGNTGLWTGRRVALSQPIPIQTWNSGVFSGSGRFVLWTSGRLYHISLPDGTVSELGALTIPQFYNSESWAIWGVVECFSNTLHLVYVRDSRNIVRSTVGPGAAPGQLGLQTVVLQNFYNLGDMASIALSLSRNRWYFHHEAGSQFRPYGEILGYAAVSVERSLQAPPFIIASPASQYLQTGGTAVLAVSDAGALPRSYQWFHNGQPLAANTNRLVITHVQSQSLGDYYVVVSNPYGSATSRVANVVVGNTPRITIHPTDVTVLAGNTLELRVEAEGDAPLFYNWYFQGERIGYTNPVLTLPNVNLIYEGEYYAVVSNYFGPVTSRTAMVTVLSPPVITSQPADLSTLPGSDGTLQVAVLGTPPYAYQWYYNGEAILAATNDTLKLSSIQSGILGLYHVVITNLYGAATSRMAQVRFVQLLPNTFRIINLLTNNSKTVEHESLTGDDCGGIAVSRSHVFVTGDSRTGRWLASDLTQASTVGSSPFYGLVCNLRTETVYSFAQGTRLIDYSGNQRITHLVELHGTNLTQTGRTIELSQAITNSYGSLVCSGFNRVGLYDRTTRMYYDIELPSGRVTPYGPAPDTAQFYIYGSETWAAWGVVEYYDEALYMVYCSLDWNTGLSSINRTRISDWQTSVVNNFQSLGDMANFTVSIPRRRWYFHHESGSEFRPEYGETAGFADAELLFVDATNAPPEILQHPADVEVVLGAEARFSVASYGGEPLSYQWRLNGTNLAGATERLLVITNAGYQHQGDYTVVVSNAFGMAVGGPARLTIDRGTLTNRLLVFGITNLWRYHQQGQDLGTTWRGTAYSDATWPQGRGLLAMEDNPAVAPINTLLSLTTPGGGAITTYYFRTTFNLPAVQGARGVRLISSNLVDDGAVIYLNGLEKARIRMNQGTVNANTFANASAPEGVYEVVTLDTNGVFFGAANVMAVEVHQQSATSSDVVFGMALYAEVLYPNDPPVILQEPADVEVDYLGRVQLTVVASGMAPLSYQWYQGNLRLPAFTGPTLELANVTSFQAGNYRVVISNAIGVVTSRIARVTVRIPPEIWDHPQSGEGWVGNALTLFVTATGTDLSYQWWHNGAPLPLATNAELALAPLQMAHAGEYYVVVSNAVAAVTSQVATVVVHGLSLPPEALQWSNGVLRLAFDVPPGRSLDIETSEDLRQWTQAASFTNPQGRIVFEDQQAAGRPRRFYRLKLSP